MKSLFGTTLAIASLAVGSYNIFQLVSPPEPVTSITQPELRNEALPEIAQAGTAATATVAQDYR